MTLVRTGAIADAYANWSRWVAHCGHCQYGAERLQPRQSPFVCSFCGGVTEVIWPTEAMIIGVERILMMRHDPSTRNWLPGETLIDLIRENGEHGVLSQYEVTAAAATPGTSLFAVNETSIRVDNLPMIKPRIRREIT